MKPQEQKDKYILMRAEGKSYSTIAKALGIGKGTCAAWEKELQEEIASRKAEQLEALYDTYFMTRKARIEKIGETLKKIDGSLSNVSLDDLPPDKLLDYKLKYQQALKEEYIYTEKRVEYPKEITPDGIMILLIDLLERVRYGEVDEARASKESVILSNVLKAYEQTELKSKIDAIEAILGGRG